MMRKIKIAFICYYSNEELRRILHQRIPWWEKYGRKLMHISPPKLSDHGVWNENAIKEFEAYEDIEVSVILPQKFISKKEVQFELRGIHYYVFRDEDSYFSSRVKRMFCRRKKKEYHQNREIIKSLLKEVTPDIVHVVGAENAFYSLSLLDVPSSVPTIIQLQTLINDPGFFQNYFMSADSYKYATEIERRILQKSTYIATRARKYINVIKESIKSDATFLDFSLALNEPVNIEKRQTTYTFVYFAKIIAKAVDYAIESFAIAHKKHPEITLDVIGSCPPDLMKSLKNRIHELGIQDFVIFEGELPTHADVIKQIRKSRFALLPVKISLTTGTIREAMANGLPVVTSDTGELGTQQLNKDKECVLLSAKGDHEAMAENMMKLLESPETERKLIQNASERAANLRTNAQVVSEWVETYRTIIKN